MDNPYKRDIATMTYVIIELHVLWTIGSSIPFDLSSRQEVESRWRNSAPTQLQPAAWLSLVTLSASNQLRAVKQEIPPMEIQELTLMCILHIYTLINYRCKYAVYSDTRLLSVIYRVVRNSENFSHFVWIIYYEVNKKKNIKKYEFLDSCLKM